LLRPIKLHVPTSCVTSTQYPDRGHQALAEANPRGSGAAFDGTTRAPLSAPGKRLQPYTRAPDGWAQITVVYDQLALRPPPPVAERNRAAAAAMAEGSGLWGSRVLEEFHGLAEYGPHDATRAELLRRLGRLPEAAAGYQASQSTRGRSGGACLSGCVAD
jgi:RNA polymerase sigma-70 factor, ECF subfamily